MPAEPTEYDGPAVRAVRERYAMSQGVFARFLCVSSATVQSWEQGRRVPSPIARRLLDEMAASPEHFRARFARLIAPTSSQSLPPQRLAAWAMPAREEVGPSRGLGSRQVEHSKGESPAQIGRAVMRGCREAWPRFCCPL